MKHKEFLNTEAKLRERVKELTCLYGVLRLATEHSNEPLSWVLQGIAELLPPAWQYPEITCGRVVLDDQSYTTRGFEETAHRQSADFHVRGERRGFVEVIYKKKCPDLYEGPFLREERWLINALAQEVSGVVERHQARQEKERLEEQLRHADRLATLGQLAAGVAHELNEPLGNVLGFAQLAQKAEGLPAAAHHDLEKIVAACLYARKIISKLRLFARQKPAEREETNLNDVVDKTLLFIEARCATNGIEIVKKLDPRLPPIFADPSQLHQVLVNLTVNAVQAMAQGGVLTVVTGARENKVFLRVEDTGAGIEEEILGKIFLPFFTTKDVDQGTGLGLSVVDSIVKTHGGSITATSSPGKGTVFEVLLPTGGAA